MPSRNAALGKASLVCSIVGVVLPVILITLAFVFQPTVNIYKKTNLLDLVLLVCLFLGAISSVVLELVALGLGIAARRTTTGKAGLIISGILVLGPALIATLIAAQDLWSSCPQPPHNGELHVPSESESIDPATSPIEERHDDFHDDLDDIHLF
ncbi:MAG: hypothetical protein IH991_25470 [Planctomycetes bacterium]|nr:hypothetical protein [Planctomycetota bacterium]